MVSLFGSLALLFAMFVHAHTVPLNYFLLAGWTILQATTIGAIGKKLILNVLYVLSKL
jgi:hypothetical protein